MMIVASAPQPISHRLTYHKLATWKLHYHASVFCGELCESCNGLHDVRRDWARIGYARLRLPRGPETLSVGTLEIEVSLTVKC